MTDRMDLPETGADFARDEQAGANEARNRDEGGRFAEGQAQPEAGSQDSGQQQPNDGQTERQESVPHARFHAVNEELRGFKERYGALESRTNEFERRLAERDQYVNQLLTHLQQGQRAPQQQAPQQPAAPPPDWFENPQAAAQHVFKEALTPYEKQLQERQEAYEQDRAQAFNNHIAISREIAGQRYGDETMAQAEKWLDDTIRSNPAMKPVLQQMIFAPGKLPGVEVVKLYQGQAPLGRPQGMEALVEAEVTRRLAALGGQTSAPQQAASQPQPTPSAQAHAQAQPNLPSSFASARNGGPRSSPQAVGARSLSEIMGR